MRSLSVTEIVSAVGGSRQGLSKALKRAALGEAAKWRGAEIVAILAKGRGAGGKTYRVLWQPLPDWIKDHFIDPLSGVGTTLKHGAEAAAERDWRYGLIEAALAHPKGARGKVISEIAGRKHFRDGKWLTVSEKSIRRWIDAYEQRGLKGLSRPKRADAGQARVILTTAWDNAVPFPDHQKQRIADAIRSYVRGLVKKGETPEWIARLAADKLAQLTLECEFDPGADALAQLCRIPGNLIRAEAVYRKAHCFNHDRKAYEDNRPRIRRTREGLMPMDIVCGDIHPVDILVARKDGSIATPRMIAWLDLGTNRLWADLVLLEPREGIRNAHVIASFVHMVGAWGAPRALYIDNGGEFNFAEFIDDALKLIDRDCRRYIDRISPWTERDSSIIRAQPYNAAAKPIEGIFGILERHHFSTIDGWIGGDRLRKKSANVGKAPAPFPGTFEELRSLIALQLAAYDVTPQKGSLKGRSPRAVYEAAIADGWGMTAIDPDTLRIAFSKEEPRVVRQGCVRHDGRLWTCPELRTYQRDRVSLLVPKYEDWSRLPVRTDQGRLLGFAEPETEFALLDANGALEAKRRAAEARAAVKALDRSAPDIDPLAERARYLAGLPAVATAPIAATIGHSAEAAEVIAGLRESPADRRSRQQREIDEELAEQLELTRRSLAAGERTT